MSSPDAPRPQRPVWLWPLTVIVLAAMGVGAFLYVFRTVSRLPGAAVNEGQKAIEGLRRVAEAFHTGTVTTTFVSYAAEATGVTRLQIAELRQTELFERTDQASAFWGSLELPELVVRARAPVQYVYTLDLEARWDFRLEEHRILVLAPPIEHNEPAVDASAIEYEVKAGSLLRDEDRALARLKDGLTRMSRMRARENVELIRELARRKTEEFVAAWLADRFADGAEYSVEVTFRDEPPPGPRLRWRDE